VMRHNLLLLPSTPDHCHTPPSFTPCWHRPPSQRPSWPPVRPGWRHWALGKRVVTRSARQSLCCCLPAAATTDATAAAAAPALCHSRSRRRSLAVLGRRALVAATTTWLHRRGELVEVAAYLAPCCLCPRAVLLLPSRAGALRRQRWRCLLQTGQAIGTSVGASGTTAMTHSAHTHPGRP
jgi:hypothetical protein